MSPAPAVVVGMGQLGGVFALGWLRTGRAVVPALRGAGLGALAAEVPAPALVLVAVPETALAGVLDALPEAWRGRVGLVQNGLLPDTWRAHGIDTPTVVSVWFEKKRGTRVKEILPCQAHGPAAELVREALAAVGVRCGVLDSEEDLLVELLGKGLYIHALNLGGLAAGGGTVAGLLEHHEELTFSLAGEILDLQEAQVGHPLPRERMIERLRAAFAAEPDQNCLGRVARQRLEGALAAAEAAGVAVPTLESIRASLDD